jgi:hypothetical protein
MSIGAAGRVMGNLEGLAAQHPAIGRDRIADRAMRTDSSDLVVISPTGRGINVVSEPAPPVKVQVRAPFRVVHDGAVYTGGDVLDVPDDEAHKLWVAAGWVQRLPEVPDEPAKAAPKRSKRSARPG